MSSAGIMEPDQVKSKMKKVKEVIDPDLRIAGRPAQAGDPDLPAPARSVRKVAMEAGWEVEVIYARGITSTPKLVHIYALRMKRPHQRVTAIWEADARAEKIAWKFSYAGTLGGFVISQEGKASVRTMPFTLNATEMKGILKADPIARVLLMDKQYEAIQNEDKAEHFICESELRFPYKKAPRKTKEESIADDEMDMVLE